MPNIQDIQEERPSETLGSRFRNARTHLGKSLPEAAQVTCINPTILANLEADNFTKMPAEVFTKGFIKLYAQYLGLDVNETLKLYGNQENFDPERPAEQTYRREILTGAAMANPLSLFKFNPRMRIIAILLTVLLAFYILGAILKVGQKHPDQTTPENELAKSLVDGNPQFLPGQTGVAPTAGESAEQAGVSGTASLTTTLPEAQPASGTVTGAPATTGAQPSMPPGVAQIAPAASATPVEPGAAKPAGEAATGR